MIEKPSIEHLDEQALQARREALGEFFGGELPVPIPAGAVGFRMDHTGRFEALVHPADDPERIRQVAVFGISEAGEPSAQWPNLPDPFMLVAYAESRGGCFWLMHRQGHRFFYFRENYFHTYAPQNTFATCHQALITAWSAFSDTAPTPGDYWHHFRERRGTLMPPDAHRQRGDPTAIP